MVDCCVITCTIFTGKHMLGVVKSVNTSSSIVRDQHIFKPIRTCDSRNQCILIKIYNLPYELPREKTFFLHMRIQRRRSAVW